MEIPLISAVIITHNRFELVQKAIKSVLNQTYKNIELIVVDDASKDGAPDLFSPLAKEQGFQYIYIPQNESQGGNHARNVGVNAAKGQYVAFLDDDDEWFPEKIEKQVTLLENHGECRFCYCGRVKDYNFGEWQVYEDTSELLEGDLSKEIFVKTQCVTSEIMVDRTLLLEVGLFDESLRFWQEYELCMRLFQKTKVSVVRENLILYRILQTDKQRLTNKLDGWEEAVAYTYNKHSKEMDQLTKKDRKRRDQFLFCDGAVRGKACGNKKAEREYLWKIFLSSKNPKDLIKAILNVDSFKDILDQNKQ